MIKVQFGTGGNPLPDFINHDIEVPIQGPLPYEDASVDFVYASHVIEHVTVQEALRFLQSCHRILKPGGIVRLVVPTLAQVTNREHGCDLINGHGHQHLWCEASLFHILWAAGFEYMGKIRRSHRNEEIDQHWRAIGLEKDTMESCYVEAER